MIGTHIGPYEVLSKLGEGGMGQVDRGRNSRLNRDVAIKVLRTHSSTTTSDWRDRPVLQASLR